jgi:hypothetical protein
VEVIREVTDKVSRMADGKMEVLLDIGEFDVDMP